MGWGVEVEWISFFFFFVAAVMHLMFFVVESILFQRKGGHKVFKIKETDHEVVKIWAFNQGFYNLFLALGMFLGLYFVLQLKVVLAGALTGFCGVSMVGAGLALWFSAPHLRRAALIQLTPPLLGLLFVLGHVSKYL